MSTTIKNKISDAQQRQQNVIPSTRKRTGVKKRVRSKKPHVPNREHCSKKLDNTFEELLLNNENCVIADEVITSLLYDTNQEQEPVATSEPLSSPTIIKHLKTTKTQSSHSQGVKTTTPTTTTAATRDFLPLQDLYKLNNSAGGAALAKRAASASYYATASLLVNFYLHYAYNCPFPKCFGHEIRHFG